MTKKILRNCSYLRYLRPSAAKFLLIFFNILLIALLFVKTAFSQIPAIEPGVSQDLAKWRASRYSNISYKLNLTLEKMSLTELDVIWDEVKSQ